MAHIIYRRSPDSSGAIQLLINGVDYSAEVYRGIELVEVGDDPQTSEVGLRVTFAVNKLDLDAESDVRVTNHFPEVAQRVRSMSAEVA